MLKLLVASYGHGIRADGGGAGFAGRASQGPLSVDPALFAGFLTAGAGGSAANAYPPQAQ